MADIFVVVFQTPRAPVVGPQIYYRNYASDQGPPPPDLDSRSMVVGRFRAPVYKQFRYNATSTNDDSVQTFFDGIERQPTFRFRAPKFNRFAFNHSAQDINGPEPDTASLVVGKFVPTKYLRFPFNSHATDPTIETNTHFIAKFKPPALKRFAFNTLAGDDSGPIGPQPDSVNFIAGKAWPVRRAVFRYNQFATEFATTTPEPETNVQFAKPLFRAPQYRQFRFNYTGCDDTAPLIEFTDASRPLIKFSAPVYRRFSFNSWDTTPPQEANPHFIGRFRATKYSAFRLNSERDDSAALPPQAHGETCVVGHFRAPVYRRFFGNHMNTARDTGQIRPNPRRMLALEARDRVLILT